MPADDGKPADRSTPPVGVVIATHNRPEQVRAAVASVLSQDYSGPIQIALVFDAATPDESLASDAPGRTVSVLTNSRVRGLAGARNTGILALDTPIVAFCDDDDIWLPGKLQAQVDLLDASPQTEFVTTAMRVDFRGRLTDRLANTDRVDLGMVVRSRMSMLHSSSFLFRREAMVGRDGFGLVDESMPRSMGEDWDLLLRAARKHPLAHIDRPLVQVSWGANSYFNDAWADKNGAHLWLLEHHPEMAADRRAHGYMLGRLAFGYAALGERRKALRFAARALRVNIVEKRVPLALLVVAGVPPGKIVDALNKRGHGI